MAKHYQEAQHGSPSTLRFVAIERILPAQSEMYWIDALTHCRRGTQICCPTFEDGVRRFAYGRCAILPLLPRLTPVWQQAMEYLKLNV